MRIKLEKHYSFKVSESNIEQIHGNISNLLKSLPKTIYDDVLICVHELIINSIKEMEVTNQENQLITISLVLTDEEAVLCLKDFGRGIGKSQLEEHNKDPMRENGRGLSMIMILSDWFCVYLENNCYAYYVVKKFITERRSL